jgi:hypothetical protein
MKFAVLLALLLWQAVPANEPPVAQPQFLRYARTLEVPSGTGQACAVLDAQVFPHAQPSLLDLRIFPLNPTPANSAGPQREVPYAITMSNAVTEETQPARVLNLGTTAAGKIAFDLEMPTRAYTDVTLQLDPAVHDFLVTAAVTGLDALGASAKSTALGSFTLFDLQSQHLSRSTTLPLTESTFPYLHIVLSIAPTSASQPAFSPAIVQGAEVPPSREEQILYTTIAETSTITTTGRDTHATFEVSPRVPIERVEFVLAPTFKGNFSRDVTVTATAEPLAKSASETPPTTETDLDADQRPPLPETLTGTILRVHATQAGREIRTEQLGLPAILGANLQRPAKIDIAVHNGDDQPLPIAAVRLEMRQRELCFESSLAAAPLALYYGDPALSSPVYDYERLFVAADKPLAAQLSPEQPNPQYTPRPSAPLPFATRHPQVLWIALILVICALGAVALKSARNVGHT